MGIIKTDREMADALDEENERLIAERTVALGQVAALRQRLESLHNAAHPKVGIRPPGKPTCDAQACSTAELLADTTEAARGWLPPDIARQLLEALRRARLYALAATVDIGGARLIATVTAEAVADVAQADAAIAAAEAHGVLADE